MRRGVYQPAGGQSQSSAEKPAARSMTSPARRHKSSRERATTTCTHWQVDHHAGRHCQAGLAQHLGVDQRRLRQLDLLKAALGLQVVVGAELSIPRSSHRQHWEVLKKYRPTAEAVEAAHLCLQALVVVPACHTGHVMRQGLAQCLVAHFHHDGDAGALQMADRWAGVVQWLRCCRTDGCLFELVRTLKPERRLHTIG